MIVCLAHYIAAHVTAEGSCHCSRARLPHRCPASAGCSSRRPSPPSLHTAHCSQAAHAVASSGCLARLSPLSWLLHAQLRHLAWLKVSQAFRAITPLSPLICLLPTVCSVIHCRHCISVRPSHTIRRGMAHMDMFTAAIHIYQHRHSCCMKGLGTGSEILLTALGQAHWVNNRIPHNGTNPGHRVWSLGLGHWSLGHAAWHASPSLA